MVSKYFSNLCHVLEKKNKKYRKLNIVKGIDKAMKINYLEI